MKIINVLVVFIAGTLLGIALGVGVGAQYAPIKNKPMEIKPVAYKAEDIYMVDKEDNHPTLGFKDCNKYDISITGNPFPKLAQVIIENGFWLYGPDKYFEEELSALINNIREARNGTVERVVIKLTGPTAKEAWMDIQPKQQSMLPGEVAELWGNLIKEKVEKER